MEKKNSSSLVPTLKEDFDKLNSDEVDLSLMHIESYKEKVEKKEFKILSLKGISKKEDLENVIPELIKNNQKIYQIIFQIEKSPGFNNEMLKSSITQSKLKFLTLKHKEMTPFHKDEAPKSLIYYLDFCLNIQVDMISLEGLILEDQHINLIEKHGKFKSLHIKNCLFKCFEKIYTIKSDCLSLDNLDQDFNIKFSTQFLAITNGSVDFEILKTSLQELPLKILTIENLVSYKSFPKFQDILSQVT